MTIEMEWLKAKIRSALISASCALGFLFIAIVGIYPSDWTESYYLTLGIGIIVGVLLRRRLPANTLSFTWQIKPNMTSEEDINALLKPHQNQMPWYYYGVSCTSLFLIFYFITLAISQTQLKSGISMNMFLVFFFGFGLGVAVYSLAFFVYVLRSWKNIGDRTLPEL